MILKIILFSGFAGITVFTGGLLAKHFNHHIKETPVKYEITHTMMSFGAGIILSAVALVLIPTSMETLKVGPLIFSFSAGTILFMFIDRYLTKKGGKTAALLAMMMDFVPEAIVLGAVFAGDPKMAFLLAIIIGLQNLPESFNAFRDLVQTGFAVKKTLVFFFFLSYFGIIGAMAGYLFLSEHPVLTAHLMTFASGGILYLLIQDIIPESKLENHCLTSLGASLGFLAGLIGKMIL